MQQKFHIRILVFLIVENLPLNSIDYFHLLQMKLLQEDINSYLEIIRRDDGSNKEKNFILTLFLTNKDICNLTALPIIHAIILFCLHKPRLLHYIQPEHL